MSEDTGPLLPHGGYRHFRSYKVASAVYDATVVFCRRFLAHDRRLSDQMIQAARSGVRNISEGSGAAGTSRKSEMKLTNVARASLSDELVDDYEDFLRQNGSRVWPPESREALVMRRRLMQDRVAAMRPPPGGGARLTGLAGLSDFVAKAEPELAANAMLCAVNQAAYLLRRQLESQARAFAEKGGFTESLYASRTRKPGTRNSLAPPCPRCGAAMVQRAAKSVPRAGQSFWGCSSYPKCKGTLSISSDRSDRSDRSDP